MNNIDVPAVVDDRKARRETGHARLRERGVLQLAQARGVPLHGAVRVEQRHGDAGVFQRAVLLALWHAEPHLGAVVLREGGEVAVRGAPHAQQRRDVDQGRVVHPLR